MNENIDKGKLLIAAILSIIGHFGVLFILEDPIACALYWFILVFLGRAADGYHKRLFGKGLLE